jgi:subtilase family serine protease
VQFQAGWGTNETELAYEGYVSDTTYGFGFIYGSGGGTSTVFAAPQFQKSLKSAYRQEPDIAWLADPFTGAIVTLSVPGAVPIVQQQAYGGTGLANYMFSALWAVADQAAGASLGQAAPLLYAARSSVATDVVPVGSTTNVTDRVFDIGGQKYFYNAATVARPLDGTTIFASALWNIPLYQDTVYAITFGTDSGLRTKPGWDPVTGLGVPNPAGLIKAAIAASAARAH